METKRTHKMSDEFTLRMLGDTVTLMRCAWLELLDELREDSHLAGRIRRVLGEDVPSVEHTCGDEWYMAPCLACRRDG